MRGEGWCTLVDTLLKAGCNLHAENAQGETPYMLASRNADMVIPRRKMDSRSFLQVTLRLEVVRLRLLREVVETKELRCVLAPSMRPGAEFAPLSLICFQSKKDAAVVARISLDEVVVGPNVGGSSFKLVLRLASANCFQSFKALRVPNASEIVLIAEGVEGQRGLQSLGGILQSCRGHVRSDLAKHLLLGEQELLPADIERQLLQGLDVAPRPPSENLAPLDQLQSPPPHSWRPARAAVPPPAAFLTAPRVTPQLAVPWRQEACAGTVLSAFANGAFDEASNSCGSTCPQPSHALGIPLPIASAPLYRPEDHLVYAPSERQDGGIGFPVASASCGQVSQAASLANVPSLGASLCSESTHSQEAGPKGFQTSPPSTALDSRSELSGFGIGEERSSMSVEEQMEELKQAKDKRKMRVAAEEEEEARKYQELVEAKRREEEEACAREAEERRIKGERRVREAEEQRLRDEAVRQAERQEKARKEWEREEALRLEEERKEREREEAIRQEEAARKQREREEALSKRREQEEREARKREEMEKLRLLAVKQLRSKVQEEEERAKALDEERLLRIQRMEKMQAALEAEMRRKEDERQAWLEVERAAAEDRERVERDILAMEGQFEAEEQAHRNAVAEEERLAALCLQSQTDAQKQLDALDAQEPSGNSLDTSAALPTTGKDAQEEWRARLAGHDEDELTVLCPITLDVMTDPVMLRGDCVTYDRHAITEWLQRSTTSPLTGEALTEEEMTLCPNRQTKSCISIYLARRGITVA